MIKIIYCKNDGKLTEYMFDNIKKNALDGRRQLVFVPETKTFEVEKALLSLFETGGSAYAETASLTRFASRYVKSEINFISEGAKLLLCKKAVGKTRGGFSYYTKGTDNPSFYSKMLESIEEIQKSGIKAEELYSAYDKGKLGGDIFDIAAVLTVYEAELEKSGFTVGDVLTVGAGMLEETADIDYDDIWLTGYTGFTFSEKTMLSALMKKNVNINFMLMTDGRDFLFNEQNRTMFAIVGMAQKCGVKSEKQRLDDDEPARDIDFLAENLFNFGRQTCEESKNVRFLSAQNIDEECDFISSEIYRLTRQLGLRYKDIALTCGNTEKYQSSLERAMNRYKIPFYTSDKTELLAKPPVAALLGAVYAVKNGFSYEAMFSFLKTGLLDISEDLICKLENYVIAWNIRGNMWAREWKNIISDYGEKVSEERIRELSDVNRVRSIVIEPLLALKEEFSQSEKGADYIKALKNFMDKLNYKQLVEKKAEEYYFQNMQREALEYVQLYDIISDAIGQFDTVSGDDTMNLTEFASLFGLVLSGYSIATVPDTIDRIVLTDYRNTPKMSPRVLFMMGCNDGDFPPMGGGSSLITERDREQLSLLGTQLSLTGEERQIEMESHIYRSIRLPKDKLYMSYSRGDGLEGQLMPSYLLKRAQSILPSIKEENITDMREAYMLYTSDTAMLLACKYLSGEEDGITAAAFWHMKNRQRDELENIEKIKSGKRGPIRSKEVIKGLYGEKINLSASRIEKIKSCPFAYFMEYGMRAKERRRIDFDAKSVGSFMHELVENAVREYVKSGRGAVHSAIEKSAKDYVTRVMNEGEMSSKLKVILDNIVEKSYKIISSILDEIECSDFKPMFCELSFGDGGVDAYSFQRGGLTVNINGKIDRVDGYVTDDTLYLKVVDYKTGIKKFHLSDIIYGLNIQMFLYMMMLGEIKNIGIETGDKKKAAAVMYIPLRTKFAEGAKPGESSETREGYVLSDNDIMEALEHSVDGKYSYIPVRLKKDGSFYANSAILSSAEFARVFRKIKDHLNDIANMIITGHIEAQPYTQGGDMTACRYCPYGEACAFDDSNSWDKMRRIKSLPDKIALSEMEDE